MGLRKFVGWITAKKPNPPYKFRSLPRRRESSWISHWIPAVAGMSGLLLAGCLEVSEPKLSIEVQGDIITTLPNAPSGIELGMTEEQVADMLRASGYTDAPDTITMTSNTARKGDCGEANPILINLYKRQTEYENQSVEYAFRAFFNDDKHDGKCEPILIQFEPAEVREPSYMKAIK